MWRSAKRGTGKGTTRIATGRDDVREERYRRNDLGAKMEDFGELNLVGQSPAFVYVLELTKKFSRCDATVLIQGETGTGKELVARAIHYLGARGEFPFIPVNCGALPDTLVESELFGHARGA